MVISVTTLRLEHRELTRSKILDAVLEIVAAGELDSLSVPAVARRSGVSLATIYRYFPSKADLVAAAAEVPSRRALAERPPPTGDGDADFAMVITAMWKEFAEHLALLRHSVASSAGRGMRKARLARSRRHVERYLEHRGVDPASADGQRLVATILLVSGSLGLLELHDRQGLPVGDAIGTSLWAVRTLVDAVAEQQGGTRT
ncbi:hypothetical protein BH18ACT1_BH18ACT1_19200 [soil metagenome]